MLQPELQKVLPRGISRLILVMMYFLHTDIHTVVQSNTWTNDPKLQGEKGGRAKSCRVCCMLGLLYFHFKVLTKLTEWVNNIFLFLKQWGLRNGLRSGESPVNQVKTCSEQATFDICFSNQQAKNYFFVQLLSYFFKIWQIIIELSFQNNFEQNEDTQNTVQHTKWQKSCKG